MTPIRVVRLFLFYPTDMAVEYTFLMQKTTDGSAVKSSLSDFGFAVRDIPWPDEETEDVATRTWPGKHGEDAYIPPSGLKLQAYDVEVEFCYKGDVGTAVDAYEALRDYLIGANGDGAELRVYDPYWRRGRQGLHVKKIGDFDPHRSNVDEVLPLKVTFRVTDPKTKITLVYVGD